MWRGWVWSKVPSHANTESWVGVVGEYQQENRNTTTVDEMCGHGGRWHRGRLVK